jgi:hypothetical protein
LFVDPDGPDDDATTWADNNFSLSAGSPCIDAADNTAVPADSADLDGDGDGDERTPLDLDGLPRFINDPATAETGVADPPEYPQIVDMGCYEFVACFGDLDGNGVVGLSDLATVLANYGHTGGAGYYDGDLDGDGNVGLPDLAIMLAAYADGCG